MANKTTTKLPPKLPLRLTRSFANALTGIWTALRRERNMRVHLAAAAGVLYFARYYALSPLEWAVLFIAIGLVLCCELINTALEHVTDIKTRQHNPVAKAAKDIAAGAVLVASLVSVAVAVALFWDIPTMRMILADIAARPLIPALWLATVLACALWKGKKKGLPRRLE